MKFFNDQLVADDLPLDDLARMLESEHIQDFALACEQLALQNSREAFALMRRFYAQAELFRQRSVLAILLDMPFAAELTKEAEEALESSDKDLADVVLSAVAEGKITISDCAILKALESYGDELHYWHFRALERIAKTPENKAAVKALSQAARYDNVRTQLAAWLTEGEET